MMTALVYAMVWSALTDSSVPAFLPATDTIVVRATGVGYPPRHVRGARARLMAQRAAEVVAVANLAKRLGNGQRARVRGFRYVSTRVRPNGSVEVVVEKRVRR